MVLVVYSFPVIFDVCSFVAVVFCCSGGRGAKPPVAGPSAVVGLSKCPRNRAELCRFVPCAGVRARLHLDAGTAACVGRLGRRSHHWASKTARLKGARSSFPVMMNHHKIIINHHPFNPYIQLNMLRYIKLSRSFIFLFGPRAVRCRLSY